MDDSLSAEGAEALAALAQALDMEPLAEGGLAAFLAAAARRARSLSDAERRARQANSTFRAASRALVQSMDPRVVLEELLDYLNWMVPYDAAVVLMSDGRGRLSPRARREWREDSSAETEAEALFMAQEAALEGEPVTTDALREHRLGLPLPGPGGRPGAVVLARRGDRFGEEEIRAAEAFAGQAASAMRNATLFEELKRADEELLRSYDETIEALSRALDLRDHETEGHTLRVTTATIELATRMGFPEAELVQLRRGALLHDIGKIGIPDSILSKPQALDEAEREIMRQHPRFAYELLSSVPFLRPALDIAYCHHERWDGTGYPRGLAGKEIPLAARLFAPVDVWDALVSDRPYRAAMDSASACALIASEAGTHFDPEVVKVFLSTFAPAPIKS